MKGVGKSEPIIAFDFSSVLQEGDALIIVPPFARLDLPSLQAHLLQACAREAGLSVSVLYANMIFAAYDTPPPSHG